MHASVAGAALVVAAAALAGELRDEVSLPSSDLLAGDDTCAEDVGDCGLSLLQRRGGLQVAEEEEEAETEGGGSVRFGAEKAHLRGHCSWWCLPIVTSCSSGSCSACPQCSIEGAIKSISGLLAPQHHSLQNWSALPGLASCHLSAGECSIEDMRGPTLVHTDDSTTRCWNGDPFAFLVVPGSAEKLYYYFPGGGVCFAFPGPIPGAVEACVGDFHIGLSTTSYGNGPEDLSDPSAVFHGYSMVSAPYCSGDGFVGNVSFSTFRNTFHQYGYNNQKVLQTWTARNFPQMLETLVIAGTSAGALGAGIWADTLLSTFKYERASVLLDSYIGVFPGHSESLLVKQLGACGLPILAPFKDECERGGGTTALIVSALIKKYPKVAFAHIQSKADFVQIGYFDVMGMNFGGGINIPQSDFYYHANSMMEVYNKYPNWVAYVVKEDFHSFMTYPVEWRQSSALGPNKTASGGSPMLQEWVRGFVNHENVSSQCAGKRTPNGGGGLGVEAYCDQALFPKTLSV